MLDLAQRSKEGPVPLKVIAKRQGISEAYLEQLFSNLKKAGLVKSVRGPKGGYLLANKPSQITVGDIIRALEGPIGLVDCALEKNSINCSKSSNCISHIVWEKTKIALIETLDSISLKDMCDEAKNRFKEINA
jgi:Rrf2 family cysteine metabolism transcriptional repressor